MLVMIFSFLWLAIVITLGFFFLFSNWPLWLLWLFFSFPLIGHCDYFGFFFPFLLLAIVITLVFFSLFSDWPLWLLWLFSFSLIGHCDYFGFFFPFLWLAIVITLVFFSLSLIGHCDYFGFFFPFLWLAIVITLVFFPFLWLAIVITFGFTSLNRETLYQSNVIIEICDAEFEYIKILPFLQGCWAIGSRLHLQGRRSELSAWCWYGTGWFLHFPTGGVVHMIQFVQHSKE